MTINLSESVCVFYSNEQSKVMALSAILFKSIINFQIVTHAIHYSYHLVIFITSSHQPQEVGITARNLHDC